MVVSCNAGECGICHATCAAVCGRQATQTRPARGIAEGTAPQSYNPTYLNRCYGYATCDNKTKSSLSERSERDILRCLKITTEVMCLTQSRQTLYLRIVSIVF